MRRILFLFCLLTMTASPLIAQEEPSKSEIRLRIFEEELTDEIWPDLWLKYHLYWDLEHRDYSPNWETIDDLADKGLDAFNDALKEVAEKELDDWELFQKAQKWLKDRAEVKLAIYEQEPTESGPSRLTVDAGWKVDKGRHHLVDAGIRLRTDPALYLKYHWPNNGRLEHDWAWYPIQREIEYRLDNMPLNLDVKFSYQYDEQLLKGRLEDLQISEHWRFGFGTSYDFDDCEFAVKGMFYAAF